MAIRKLLLPLPAPTGAEAALATGLMVARAWDAHMTVLHVRTDDQRAQAVRAVFSTFAAVNGLTIGEATPGKGGPVASFGWVSAREPDQVVYQARLSDMSVIPHPEAGDDASSADMLHAMLFDSGRPVLIAPHAPPVSLGRRVCIGWNGTAEAASAVYALTPWLKRADKVRILSASGYQRRGPAGQELADFLAMHGVHADWVMFSPADGSVGAGLLAAAAAFDADLLAMGAYSHSRWRQMILGGVTRHVLGAATLPVFMNR
jgi:nucleotide-binding universal stress UspA family protein